jgi:pyridinium-3,5-bisthiocarboxylic acid mononucleotide nickel chelatase
MPTPATIAYADCFSGISGDMFLSALIHAGVPQKTLLGELSRLDLPPFTLDISTTKRQGISAIRLKVESGTGQQLRTLPDLLAILEKSSLTDDITRPAAAVFRALAEAEAKVHAIDLNSVHFHEIGAMDTIIDVVGVIICLRHLGIQRLVASPLPLGRGFVDCAHGRLPLPAPAVCELLNGIPAYGDQHSRELVTPTGAALLKILADDFGPLPAMTPCATGYGAGSHLLEDNQPNLLRLIVGTVREVGECQRVEIIETNLDDWSPEGFPHLSDLLFACGALDVTLAAIQMKKGRPGFRLQVISSPAHAQKIKDTILSETTAIGLRFRTEERLTLSREQIRVDTPWGEMGAKRVITPAGPRIYPEYEECRDVALRHQVPLQEVYRAVMAADRGDRR